MTNLSLTLLVTWILADDTEDALTLDDAAVATKSFYRWSYFHETIVVSVFW